MAAPLETLIAELNRQLAILNKNIVSMNKPGSSAEKKRFTRYGTITVTDTPTLLREANAKRIDIVITNSSSTTLFVGTDDRVTVDTGSNPGYEVLSQGSFYGSYKGDIYGVIATGEITLTYWEEEEE
jgi:hypothetical protein